MHAMEHLSTRGVVRWFCDQIPGLDPASRDAMVDAELAPIPLGGPNASLFIGLHEDGQMLSLPLATRPVSVSISGSVVRLPAVNPHSVLHGETFFQLSRRDRLDGPYFSYRLDEFYPLHGKMWVHYAPLDNWLQPNYGWLLNEVSFNQVFSTPLLQLAS